MDLRKQITEPRDFSTEDISGWNLAHNDLTGCAFGRCVGTNFVCCSGENIDFARSDISSTTFEKCSESVLACLIGATWKGQRIGRVSGWLIQSDPWWSFATDAFVQIGCMQRTWNDWLDGCATIDTMSDFLANQRRIDLHSAWEWWVDHKPIIQEWIESCGN